MSTERDVSETRVLILRRVMDEGQRRRDEPPIVCGLLCNQELLRGLGQ